MRRFFAALTLLAALGLAAPAAAQIVQNDNLDDNVNLRITSPALIDGEAYEAVLDIPQAWLPATTGQRLELLGVRVLMFDNPQAVGNSCGRFSVEVYEEPTTPKTSVTCFSAIPFGTKDPGNTIFDLRAVPVPNGPLGFEVYGQPTMGNAAYTDLLFSAINMNPNVTLNPVYLNTTRVRVVIRALDLGCTRIGLKYPVMGTDASVQADRNYVYGSYDASSLGLGICGPHHFAWEDFAPFTSQNSVGDFVIRLITNYNTSNPMPDMGGGGMDMSTTTDMSTAQDMNMSMDMGGTTEDMGGTTEDMGGTTEDMGGTTEDMGTEPTDMGGGDEPDADGSGDALAIESITPNQGPPDASTSVVILGQGFEPGVEVLIGAEAIGVIETRSERIRATVPEGLALGTYDVIITNPDGASDILLAGYSVVEPGSEVVDGDNTRGGGVDDGCGCDTTSRATTHWAALFAALALAFGVVLRRREF